jgi:hypothetical protein
MIRVAAIVGIATRDSRSITTVVPVLVAHGKWIIAFHYREEELIHSGTGFRHAFRVTEVKGT